MPEDDIVIGVQLHVLHLDAGPEQLFAILCDALQVVADRRPTSPASVCGLQAEELDLS